MSDKGARDGRRKNRAPGAEEQESAKTARNWSGKRLDRQAKCGKIKLSHKTRPRRNEGDGSGDTSIENNLTAQRTEEVHRNRREDEGSAGAAEQKERGFQGIGFLSLFGSEGKHLNN